LERLDFLSALYDKAENDWSEWVRKTLAKRVLMIRLQSVGDSF
jgi:hypothetical protein